MSPTTEQLCQEESKGPYWGDPNGDLTGNIKCRRCAIDEQATVEKQDAEFYKTIGQNWYREKYE